jgi:hypothetical protein
MAVQLDHDHQAIDVIKWLCENQIQVLNIAGPRESKIPGIYEKTKAFLEKELIWTFCCNDDIFRFCL